jgi:hypothetical protein
VVSACPQFIKVAVVLRALRCMLAARDVRFRTGQQLKDTFWLLRVHVWRPRGRFEVHEWITRQPSLSRAQRPYPGAPYGMGDAIKMVASTI